MRRRMHNGLRNTVVVTSLVAGLAVTASVPAGAAAGWNGTFDGFSGGEWSGSWGIHSKGQWGYDDMSANGSTLDVRYGKGSSAPSCKDCPDTGGGQFYQDLSEIGRDDLEQSDTLHLKYQVRFAADFDFGRGGKLPGLYGGEPGNQSGGNHGDGWSTRFMWRDGGKGEVYVYTPDGDGYGKDVGLGAWHFQADGKQHTIEQAITRSDGRIQVWYDGKQVLDTKEAPGIGGIPFNGTFFSTFFGGHETSWGPDHEVWAHFSDFSVNTAH